MFQHYSQITEVGLYYYYLASFLFPIRSSVSTESTCAPRASARRWSTRRSTCCCCWGASRTASRPRWPWLPRWGHTRPLRTWGTTQRGTPRLSLASGVLPGSSSLSQGQTKVDSLFLFFPWFMCIMSRFIYLFIHAITYLSMCTLYSLVLST